MALLVLQSDPGGVGSFTDGPAVISELDLRATEPWGSSFPLVRISVQGRPPDLFSVGALTICSSKFRDVLAGFSPPSVAYYPVEITGYEDFTAMQVFGRVEVIDREGSDLEMMEIAGFPKDWVRRVHRLSLVDRSDVIICRAARSFHQLIVVDSKVGKALRGLTGVWLRKPEDYPTTVRAERSASEEPK